MSKYQYRAGKKKKAIKPKTVRIGDEVRKGYELSMFTDAFQRYLDPQPEADEEQVNPPSSIDTAEMPETPPPPTECRYRRYRQQNKGLVRKQRCYRRY